jgi:hypothetical protein
MRKPDNTLILYQDENGVINVSVRFSDEDFWLTQSQIAEIYDTTQQNIDQHIRNIYADDELAREATYKKFLLIRTEGKRQVERSIDHYNLDMIIAIGYRMQSQIATRFRRWATQRLHEYIQKGFALDDERLKQGGNRYFRELLQRIRDIRSSERNFYQKITDIYATAIDYDPRSDMTKKFFATVQNKLHFAVHAHTAAELIHDRVSNEKPLVGMTKFQGKLHHQRRREDCQELFVGAGIVATQPSGVRFFGCCRIPGGARAADVHVGLDRRLGSSDCRGTPRHSERHRACLPPAGCRKGREGVCTIP